MLFIVKGRVSKRGYMQDDDEVEEVMHPVEAADEFDAREVFCDHFSAMSRDYDVYYSASVLAVYETLSKAA